MNTLYAIAIPLDQTFGFLDGKGSFTIKHSEAKLYDNEEQANEAAKEGGETVFDLVPVTDVEEFKSRPDTW